MDDPNQQNMNYYQGDDNQGQGFDPLTAADPNSQIIPTDPNANQQNNYASGGSIENPIPIKSPEVAPNIEFGDELLKQLENPEVAPDNADKRENFQSDNQQAPKPQKKDIEFKQPDNAPKIYGYPIPPQISQNIHRISTFANYIGDPSEGKEWVKILVKRMVEQKNFQK